MSLQIQVPSSGEICLDAIQYAQLSEEIKQACVESLYLGLIIGLISGIVVGVLIYKSYREKCIDGLSNS